MDDLKYRRSRAVRRGFQSRTGRFRAGVLAPVMAVAVRGDEGGVLSQSLSSELDPIAGRMITEMYMEVTSVFCPVEAIEALRLPNEPNAGLTELIRQKLVTGAALYGLEAENELSKRMKVNPRSVGGVKQVSVMCRLAHNAAVNHLRLRRYDRATQVAGGNFAVTPAIVSQTVLDMLNGVLDPDDRINGAVQLQLPSLTLPVDGIGFVGNVASVVNPGLQARGRDAAGDFTTDTYDVRTSGSSDNASQSVVIKSTGSSGTTARPDVTARLNGVLAGQISLDDLHNAQTRDRLVREMRAILEDDPVNGEEQILRWAHGLKVEKASNPWVIFEERIPVNRAIVPATDTAGVLADTMRTDGAVRVEFTVPIPSTELGGVIVTFACLKPDETLGAQPHPYLSDVWKAENFVADELMLDPVPVTVREMDADCAQASETNVLFYTGYNALKQSYVDYGLSRQLNPTTVANKTAVWQYQMPLSVTPDNILYPANFPQTPFVDQNAEVVTYTVTSTYRIQTPTIFGPTPVEELPVINANTLFDN